MISSSFSWIARVSRFCVYCSENTIRNVKTDAIADGHSSQLVLKPPTIPQRAQPATRKIAARNAYGDPTKRGVAIARRRSGCISAPLLPLPAGPNRQRSASGHPDVLVATPFRVYLGTAGDSPLA